VAPHTRQNGGARRPKGAFIGLDSYGYVCVLLPSNNVMREITYIRVNLRTRFAATLRPFDMHARERAYIHTHKHTYKHTKVTLMRQVLSNASTQCNIDPFENDILIHYMSTVKQTDEGLAGLPAEEPVMPYVHMYLACMFQRVSIHEHMHA